MSSENQVPMDSLTLEEFMRTQTGIIPHLLPLFLGFAISAENRQTVLVLGSGDVDSVLRELSNKDGPLPATKASIEALPTLNTTEVEREEECSICLTEYEIGGEAKEMPCKHRYHSGCIDKWLGIHGSCPVCRYQMPVDQEGNKKGGAGGILVLIGNHARTGTDSDSDSGSDSLGDGSSPQ